MNRECDFNEISGGRIYDLNDMVATDCNDCKGCFECCCHMGTSILLDPLDVCRLTENLKTPFEDMLEQQIELGICDGVILPNLKMVGTREGCAFLNEKGRCTIHSFRPGICRLFPLGRIYEGEHFRYFLQVHECKKPNKTKVKVKKWIDTDNLAENTLYIEKWHSFLKKMQEEAKHRDVAWLKQVNLTVLSLFFQTPYEGEAKFYTCFEERLQVAENIIFIRNE